uniref:Uncharacterized protein n=1 Tax=Plectus sambesii TaxID=2011161 RepID=A0A914W4C4_9BILA
MAQWCYSPETLSARTTFCPAVREGSFGRDAPRDASPDSFVDEPTAPIKSPSSTLVCARRPRSLAVGADRRVCDSARFGVADARECGGSELSACAPNLFQPLLPPRSFRMVAGRSRQRQLWGTALPLTQSRHCFCDGQAGDRCPRHGPRCLLGWAGFRGVIAARPTLPYAPPLC